MLLGDKAYARQTLPTVGLKCFRKVTGKVDPGLLLQAPSLSLSLCVTGGAGGVTQQPKQIPPTLDPHLLPSSCLFAKV